MSERWGLRYWLGDLWVRYGLSGAAVSNDSGERGGAAAEPLVRQGVPLLGE